MKIYYIVYKKDTNVVCGVYDDLVKLFDIWSDTYGSDYVWTAEVETSWKVGDTYVY